ncbi:alpha/beta hydrolase [Roseomonas sp. OT10]|uniref:alpha/beta hydrolase n=1 Tax=Roseomonas cutis TaxID=2897332 RepID=UPI001E4C08ED|nr:alpha/beta hydrolase [Roseomonas sp. OT10]UFN48712.1 alpha/beta hydrolase [Roseomonas sp. OT10]
MPDAVPPGGGRVLLLHGIARRAASMGRMERALRAAGYGTLNLDYAARHRPLEALAEEVAREARDFLARPDGALHIVAHSMGGLLARILATRHRPPALGRVVMLGTPNGGSEVADLLSRNLLYRRFFGPAGAQLVTCPEASLRAALGPVDYPLGVIAGDRSLDPIASWLLLPGPNDGRVCVARTRVEGMADHLVLHVTHTLMMRHPEVIRQTLHFLRHGRFDPAAAGR